MTSDWHCAAMLSALTSAWIMASLAWRSRQGATREHGPTLIWTRLVAIMGWAWYLTAVVAMPGLHDSSCVIGRPLKIRGRLTFPSVYRRRRNRRNDDPPRVSRLDRNHIGNHWLECARGEFASVPAFTRLAVQLAVVDAPLELIDWAERSALEERVHAERTLGLAERMLGRSLSLKFGDALPALAPMTIAELAVESLIDGCLNEGCAAREARLRTARSGFALPRHCDHEALRNFGWIEPAICEEAHAQVLHELQTRLAALLSNGVADQSAQLVSVAR